MATLGAEQRRASGTVLRRMRAAITPRRLARLIAFLGAVSLVSAFMPSSGARMQVVAEMLPQFPPAAARTGSAAVGVFLLWLASGVARRKQRAWAAAVCLSSLAVVLHLAKGPDVEQAALSTVVLVMLVLGREHFTARPDPRTTRSVLWTAIGAVVAATTLGFLLITLEARHEAAGTTALQRLGHALLGLVGISGPVQYTSARSADHAAVALLVLGSAALLTVLGVALRPSGGPHYLRPDEEADLRDLIARNAHSADSLSYFALRRDRSVVFSRSGKAAVSYRVVGGVTLAGGDPLGDPEAWPGAIAAWLDEADRFGWRPAVLGASEAGARAYGRAGLDALEIGDEAVVEIDDFDLAGRRMRPVRQAVARVKRAGYTIRCELVEDVPGGERDEVARAAEEWRDGQTERGFSMALGRFQDPLDHGCALVRAFDGQGRLCALLHLVPWGDNGLSLDLMRRDRDTENGTVEAMVVALVEVGPKLGCSRLSLNFAVFRSVFERGERLGAGPVLRLWHGLLLRLSRFWQIEALYRANAKYHPVWTPRFLCFREARDLPGIGVAALRAEAFLQAPAWTRWLGRGAPTSDAAHSLHEAPRR